MKTFKVEVGDLFDAGHHICLLYTSDAADEGLGVDLGGRRIIKKKKRGEGWREGVGGGARRQSGSERLFCFFFQAEDGIRDLVRSRGLGDVYKRQILNRKIVNHNHKRKISRSRNNQPLLTLMMIFRSNTGGVY